MQLWTPEEKLNYIYAFCKYKNKDVELDFWQDDFIKNRNRNIILLKSRQTGFSFSVALKGIVKALDPARINYTKQFVSYNEDDAQEKIRYAREFYDSIPDKYKKKLIHSNSTMLEFQDVGSNTTSRLISMPCRPPRGRNGDVCLDEFAIYLPRLSNEIYTAASFCTLRQGCIEIGSSPLGTIGKFYEICTNKAQYPYFSRYFVPWWYSSAMCNDVKTAVQTAKELSTSERVERFGNERLKDRFFNSTLEDFQQECECSFIDSASSYISLELIANNTPGMRESEIKLSDSGVFTGLEIKAYNDVDEAVLNYNPNKHGSPLYLGYDVARYRDASAFYVFGIKDGKKRAFLRLEKVSCEFAEQKEILNKLMHGLPIKRACMDCSGMGLPLYEELKKTYGDRLEGVQFNINSKEQMAMSVKFGLEKGEFELENDRDFHAQIHSIKQIPTSGGAFRYDAERNEKGHADSFWAWAMANYASLQLKTKPAFYDEYYSKKTSNELKLGQEEPKLNRGKSLNSVLRGFGVYVK